ncbi:alpha-2 adrenergic receptor [Trichonephila clavipes]|uniref:Alpha-2 adrenergic receptor n=1 Tax=Trichonephila clavipes TaxID=2585209 RepID=A0A8X6R6C2_TRICX|nr:alpha-2 adrenergic receptor [Trichonephila clavipes]
MIVQFRNEKVSNHGSIPITIDCNVVAFIVFEEGFHQPIKRTKQSVFLDVTVCFDIHLWISFTPNAAVLFVDVAIQPELRFIAKQNSLMKIGNNGNLVLGPFHESTPCLMIVLMNCQTKLRINHLTAVKSVAILESNANLNFYTWKKNSLVSKPFNQINLTIEEIKKQAAKPAAVGVFDGHDTNTCILQLQRNPFLTPEESNPVDRKMREALNLHWSGSQRFLLSQNIGL